MRVWAPPIVAAYGLAAVACLAARGADHKGNCWEPREIVLRQWRAPD